MEFITLILVILPCDLSQRVPSFLQPATLRSLRSLNEKLELWESSGNYGECLSEIRWARSHIWDSLNCPGLGSCQRLPEESIAIAKLRFNQSFQESIKLRAMLALHRAEEYEALLLECRKIERFWALVVIAQERQPNLIGRRQALREIRDRWSEHWHKGTTPGSIP